MISKNIFLFFLFVTSISFSTYAVNHSKDKTKVIFAFDNESKQLTGIILYDAVQGKYGESLIQNYKNITFFIGYINGEFETKNGEIRPLKGSELILIKDRNSDLYKDPNLGLWDKYNKYPQTDVFFKNTVFTTEPFYASFDYKEWPCKWRGFAEKNDKSYLVINVI